MYQQAVCLHSHGVQQEQSCRSGLYVCHAGCSSVPPFSMCCLMAICHASSPCPQTTEAYCRIAQLPQASASVEQHVPREDWLCCTGHRAVQLAWTVSLSCYSRYIQCSHWFHSLLLYMCLLWFKLHSGAVKLPAHYRSWAAKKLST